MEVVRSLALPGQVSPATTTASTSVPGAVTSAPPAGNAGSPTVASLQDQPPSGPKNASITNVAQVASGIVAWLALCVSVYVALRQRVFDRRRQVVDFWASTSEMRFNLRDVLPYEFNDEEVEQLHSRARKLFLERESPARCGSVTDGTGEGRVKTGGDEYSSVSGRPSIERRAAFEYLSLIETLAAGVKRHLFDFETIQKIDGRRIGKVTRVYGYLIQERRQVNEGAFELVIWLCAKLDNVSLADEKRDLAVRFPGGYPAPETGTACVLKICEAEAPNHS